MCIQTRYVSCMSEYVRTGNTGNTHEVFEIDKQSKNYSNGYLKREVSHTPKEFLYVINPVIVGIQISMKSYYFYWCGV